MRRPLIAVLLGSLLLAASPGVAHAHADAVGSSPRQGAVLSAAPHAITIRFSEAVNFDSPPVLQSKGAAVPSNATLVGSVLTVRPSRSIGRGISTVTWHVISDDGHPVSGVLAFQVGAPGPRGARSVIATTPAVPAVLSGSRTGPLSILFGSAGSSGEVEWTHPRLGGPITWRIAPGSRTAAGILPMAGSWHMKAILQSPEYAVVIVTGEVTIHE